jgi:hypothetical protein
MAKKTTQTKSPKGKAGLREDIGRLSLDIAKLLFGSFILGGILRGEVPQYLLILAGLAGFIVCAVIGLVLINLKKD